MPNGTVGGGQWHCCALCTSGQVTRRVPSSVPAARGGLCSLGSCRCAQHLPSPCRQYDLRESSKRSEVLIDLTEYCGQLVEAKCLTVNPQDNNYLAVGANGPFVRLYDIRMIHNHR